MQAWMRFLIQVLDAFPGSMPTAVGNSVRTPDPDHEGRSVSKVYHKSGPTPNVSKLYQKTGATHKCIRKVSPDRLANSPKRGALAANRYYLATQFRHAFQYHSGYWWIRLSVFNTVDDMFSIWC